MLNRIEVDQAVFAAVLSRAWQFLSGPFTWFLIALFFTDEEQGYYFTFGSLLQLQLFVELGLNTAIIHIASHEWAHLELAADGSIQGEPAAYSRLISLVRFVVRWYAIAILAFVVLVGGGGLLFFSLKDSGQVDWQAPWVALVLATGSLLWTLPLASVLEGCNEVVAVNKYRFFQAVLGTLTVWTCLTLGFGLWTLVASSVVRFLVEGHLIGFRYRNFFATFLQQPPAEQIDWKKEVWPLQWKLGLQAVFRFFAFFLFNPVLFYFHSPAVAGRFGMVWNALTAIQAAAFSWVQTRNPLFGILVAKKDYRELDRVFFRLTAISTAVLALVLTAMCFTIFGLQNINHRIAILLSGKVLELKPTIVFCIGVLLFHLPQCYSCYLLAHKKNPMYVLSVVSNILIGIGVFIYGARSGAIGAAIAFTGIIAFISLPGWTLIWMSCRRRWHSDEFAADN